MAANDKLYEGYPVPCATIQTPYVSRLELRRSIFVTQTAHCPDAKSAREFVAAIRCQNPDATHNCWAFVAGSPGNTANIGFSDDGEPHGTAGRPILNVLLHCGAGQIATVVSRWFGGIKLGKGGLARAYQEAALENVKNMPIALLESRKRFNAVLDYGFLDAFRRMLASVNATLELEEYEKKARFSFTIPASKVEETTKNLIDASSGRIRLTELADEQGPETADNAGQF